jgi:hypothetical protein
LGLPPRKKHALATQGTFSYTEATRYSYTNHIFELKDTNKTLNFELKKLSVNPPVEKYFVSGPKTILREKKKELETTKPSYTTLITYKTFEENYYSIQSALNYKGVEEEEKSEK